MARIAVVDDRVTNRNILTRLAASVEEGLAVGAYPGPLEALEAFDAGLLPDLIITDFNMPDMDGASFVRALRSRSALVDVPIIVITVYQDREFCYRALEAGATDFLLSPVDHLEFRARARNLLTLRRQQLLLAERAADLERELHTKQYALQSGVLDEKVLETGLSTAGPSYDTLSAPSGTRWLLTSKAPLSGGSGRASEVLTVALDVTELRAAEASTTAP